MSSGQTYIVTGGNRGLGLDVCRKLATAGHHIILCSRSLNAGANFIAAIRHLLLIFALYTQSVKCMNQLEDLQDLISYYLLACACIHHEV